MKRLFLLAFALLLTAICSGCVRRIVTINSQPTAAQVYFDRQLIGQTPLSHEFLHYGGHYLELVKEGYANLRTSALLKGPIYERFPFSLFAELIFPWTIKDEHLLNFNLEKGQSKKAIISPIKQPQPSLPASELEIIEQID